MRFPHLIPFGRVYRKRARNEERIFIDTNFVAMFQPPLSPSLSIGFYTGTGSPNFRLACSTVWRRCSSFYSMPTVSPASGETPSKIFTISICCKTRTNPQTLSDFISFCNFSSAFFPIHTRLSASSSNVLIVCLVSSRNFFFSFFLSFFSFLECT